MSETVEEGARRYVAMLHESAARPTYEERLLWKIVERGRLLRAMWAVFGKDATDKAVKAEMERVSSEAG